MQRHAVFSSTFFSTAAKVVSRSTRFNRSGLQRGGVVSLAVVLTIAAGLLAPRSASAQITQTDIGTYFDTSPNNAPAQIQDSNFAVSAGANVLVVELMWRTATQITAANAPTVSFNGTAMTGIMVPGQNQNYSQGAVFYLFNPTNDAVAHNLHIDYGVNPGALGNTPSAFDAFTLGGVDTHQAPETITGHTSTHTADGQSVNSVSFSNLAYGSWATAVSNFRPNGNLLNATTFTADPGDASALITNGQGGAAANGNLFDVVPAGQNFATYAGALLSNITTPTMQIRETQTSATLTRFTTGGIAFAPLVAAPSAPVSTWNGGGPGANWMTGGNWGGTAPVAGNALTFSGAINTGPVNDFPAATSFGGIRFDSTAATFTLTGADIGLTGDIVNLSPNLQNVNLNVALNGGNGLNPTPFVTAATGNIFIGGSLSGSAGMTLNGPGTVTLNVANILSGNTSVINGTLRINNANSLQNSPLVVGSAGTVTFGAGVGTFNLAGLAGAGNITLTDAGAGPATLVIPNNGSSTAYSGNVSGKGGLTINSAATVTMTGTNSYLGATTIQAGTLKASSGYRYYRFTVTNLVNAAQAGNLVQLSELQYFSPTGTWTPAVRAFDFSDNKPNEIAPNLNDANTGTKWLDTNFNNHPVTYDFGTPQVVTQYNIATANDTPARDPTAWTIAASNDGVNFTTLDSQAGIAAPANRFTWYNGGGTGPNPGAFFNLALPANTPLASIPSTSSVVMSSNTTLDISNGALTIGSLADAAGNPAGHQILLGSGTLTTGNDGTNTIFSGAVNGSGSLVKIGGGIFTLAGVSTHTGATTVSNGTLRLASGSGLGNTAIGVANGAKLQPRPSTGTTISAGATSTLALSTGSTYDMAGDGNAGTFSVGGNLTLGNNLTLNFDIGTNVGATVTDVLAAGGAAAGSGTATINVTGFGGSNLAFGRYNLISAASAGLTTETFMLGNSTVVVNGTTYGLSLIPGPTTEQLRVASPANNGGWIQTGSANPYSWGTPGNWAGGLIPGAAGDIATFGASTANNETINLDQARSLGVLTFSNSGGGNYTIAGNGFTLTLDGLGAGVVVTNSTSSNTISAPVNINDATLIGAAAGTSLTLSGVVSSTGGQSVTIGTGGTGTVVLSNTNTFSGSLTVASGKVSVPTVNNVSTDGPLGNQASVTLGAAGGIIGTVEYTGGSSSSSMPFIIAGSGGGSVQVDTGAAALTLSGNLTGLGSFGTSGPGTVILTGAGNNFSGGLKLNNGTLRVSNAAAGTIGSGNVTFGASNTPTLDLNANSPTAGFLSGSGTNGLVTNSAGGTSTLTVSGAGSATFAGSINKGPGDIALAVAGGGTQILTGVSNFTGGISVQNGTLQVGAGSLATNAVTLGSGGAGGTSGVLVLGDGPVSLTVSSLTLAGGTANAVVGGASAVSNLTFNNAAPAVVSANLIGGPGANQNNLSITAAGPSTVTLTGSNTYSGGSIVNAGVTLAAGPVVYGSTPIGSGNVNLAGGTLALKGVSNASGLVANLYSILPGNLGGIDPAYSTLATMASHFGRLIAPSVSVATTTGGKANLDFSNNGYGNAAVFNAPGPTTAAYGFAPAANYETTMTGYINVTTAGNYIFSATSDDGTVLFIDGGDGTGPNGLPAVNNNAYQGATTVTSAVIPLTTGLHALTLGFFQGGGGAGALFQYDGPDTGVGVAAGVPATTTIPNAVLSLTNGGFIPTQSYAGGLTVTANSTLNITNSLAVSMGNSSLGAATLNVASSDPTANPYSLTLGATNLTGNATINIANSTGGGPGTVTLGGVSGGSSLTKQGPGTLVLSASGTYSGGTTVAGGTVQANLPGSLGTGAVTINHGTTLRVIASSSTQSLIAGFNGGANWTVTSNGIVSPPFAGGTLTLTDGANGEQRSAFFNTPLPIVNGSRGFTASFTFQDVNGAGADGVTFCLQNDSRGAAAIGGGGGGLGYGADASPSFIGASVAHEINVYNGHVRGTNFVNSFTNPGTNFFNNTFPAAAPPPPPAGAVITNGGVNVASTDPINVVLTYDPVAQTVTENLTDTVTNGTYMFVFNSGDLTTLANGVDSTTAFVGFTGATGGVNATMTVSNFNFGVAAPTTYGNNLVIPAAATATIDITPTAGNSTATMGTLTIGAGGTLNKVNTGILEVREAANLAAGASINVNAGTMRFVNTTGNAAVLAGVTATVTAGATLELAGAVSNLSNPSAAANRVHVVNNSTQASGGSLLVSGTNQQVGAIDGIGDTVVNAGASLTANHIIQNALVIGGSAGNLGTVTIAASDASGNPVAQSSGLTLAGSLAPNAPFGSGTSSPSSLSGGAATSNGGSSLGGGAVPGGGLSAVPEPSTVLLLVIGSLACLLPALRRRARR